MSSLPPPSAAPGALPLPPLPSGVFTHPTRTGLNATPGKQEIPDRWLEIANEIFEVTGAGPGLLEFARYGLLGHAHVEVWRAIDPNSAEVFALVGRVDFGGGCNPSAPQAVLGRGGAEKIVDLFRQTGLQTNQVLVREVPFGQLEELSKTSPELLGALVSGTRKPLPPPTPNGLGI